jgi:hypothetical protein
MGLLDKAKKLAEQAKDRAQDAASEVKARAQSAREQQDSTVPAGYDPRWGTPYMPGMLGRTGWREQGLVDPAAVLPIADRDRAGIPRSTKSVILEQPFGMGRRWTTVGRSAGLYYRLHPDHQAWEPPAPATELQGVPDAKLIQLDDGRAVVTFGPSVVLEVAGVDEAMLTDLARAVQSQLGAG